MSQGPEDVLGIVSSSPLATQWREAIGLGRDNVRTKDPPPLSDKVVMVMGIPPWHQRKNSYVPSLLPTTGKGDGLTRRPT